MAIGFGLSSLGLGQFIPEVSVVGAVLLVVGAAMVALDR